MKKLIIVAALAALAQCQSTFSQTNADSTMITNPPALLEAGTNPPVLLVVTNAPASVADTNVNTLATTNAPAVMPVAEQGADTNAPAVAPTIPLIQFQEVPITTAVDNLARQAGINYLLDPRIGYGQPDQNGVVKAEPVLSIRWENITAQHALMALLDNYGMQIVEDPKTKISRITIKDPTAPPPLVTRVIQLKYASVSNMEASVVSTLTDKRSRVVPDTRTSQLIVVATEKEQVDVDALISQLDKPTRQVLIETKLVEISSNPSTKKGIDWSGTLQAQNITFGNGVMSGTSTLKTGSSSDTVTTTLPGGRVVESHPTSAESSILSTVVGNGGLSLNTANGFTPGVGFLNADGVKAVLSFLNQSSDAQVVSTPRVVTLDNETATISVTRAFPVFSSTAGTQGSPGGSSVGYTNVGTVLSVTPRISANDYIRLKVTPQVSSFFGTVTKTVAGVVNQADVFDTRELDTQVLIPNANTLVMGGMVKDNPQASYTKVPVLGDIPYLGHAFRSENKQLDKDNLLIFITPTIVKDTDFAPTTTQFLQSRPMTMKAPMNPHNTWDSSKPAKDWSNPDPLSEAGSIDTIQPAKTSAN